MLIPQGMAYAAIAGLPPIYGLYASLVPLLVYAALGTSRQLAVGPVAMVSLLVASGVAPLAGGDPKRTIALALGLALLVGVIQLGLGLARFGFVVSLLSHPVLAGFTSAAALIIGSSQLKSLLGVALPRSHSVPEVLVAAGRALPDWNWTAVTLGVAGIVLIASLRRWNPRFPAALVTVALGVSASVLLGLEASGVPVVGPVPSGLPGFALPVVSRLDLVALLPTALVISLVGFMESIAVAQLYAARNRYSLNANRELVALGAANLAGSVFQAYPTTGGFSRTAVNAQAGARTPMAAVVSAAVIGLTLLFLTPLFRPLPDAILAAIVIVAVAGLFDWKQARELWRVDRRDFASMLATFLATLALGIELGILVGVGISIALLVHQSSAPHTAVMGRLAGTSDFRNVARYPEAEVSHDVAILRVDESLHFANAGFVEKWILQVVNSEPLVRALVLDLYPVNRVDSTAIHMLQRVVRELKDRGIEVHFSGVKGPVRDRLTRAGMDRDVAPARFHMNVGTAATAAAAAHPGNCQGQRGP